MTHDMRMDWLHIDGTRYEVSCCGDVRHARTKKRLRGHINTDGYIAYQIEGEYRLSHVLVAETFLAPPKPGQTQVAHRNGSRIMNHWRNLRWSTPLANQEDRKLHGNGPIGEQNGRAKITAADVRYIRSEYQKIKRPGSGRKVSELDEQFGLHRATVLDIAMKRTWTHV